MPTRRSWILGCATASLGRRADAFDDETWLDASRGRALPLRIRWPDGEGPCGAVIFSHGLGGDRGGGSVWGAAWQRAGFVVLHVQHPGSDSSLLGEGLAGLRRGAGARQYLDRIADARFVLDEVERRRVVPGPWQRVRPDAIGFAGHSFGARLTQAIAGERPGLDGAAPARFDDPRPGAFIAFSPGFGAVKGGDDAEATTRFGAITRPFLCITGSADGSVGVGEADHASRRAVFRGLPAGHKAELVLDAADHMTFAGREPGGLRSLRREPGAAALQPRHHDIVARISSDWWRWRLLGDARAAAALQRPEGLQPGDIWQQA